MVTTPQKLTASETVLLAAADLAASGKQEFSEWDLTVAAWTIDRLRFGLRGYAQSYPDHKRVMMEIMGQKASSPVQQKYLEKIRPNYYRLTPLGKATAARIRSGVNEPPAKAAPKAATAGVPGAAPAAPVAASKPTGVKGLYEAAAVHIGRPEFRRWEDNPEEPKDWFGAAAFLGLGKDSKEDAAARMDEVRREIQDAIDWCSANEVAFLTRGSGQGGAPIHVRDLANMLDFLQALVYRFPEKLEKSGKHKKRFDD